MSPQIHPSGFRISDRPVAASFAHPDSFQPIDNVMLRDDACIPSSLVLGGVEGTWVRYWDDSSTLAMLEFQVAQPAPTVQTVKERKEKKKVKGHLHICPLMIIFILSTASYRHGGPTSIDSAPSFHVTCFRQTRHSEFQQRSS